MLLRFPDDNVRDAIHSAIDSNANGKLSRMESDIAIWRILTSYGLTRIHLSDCTVKLGEPITTSLGWFPTTYIITNNYSKNSTCPQCGGKGGYLEGDKEVIMGCQECGAIFKFEERGTKSEHIPSLRGNGWNDLAGE